jgi:hypothetical protein
LWVKRKKFAFDIEIEYVDMPYFCFTCNSIGNSSDHRRKDPANNFFLEMVATKNDPPAKKLKHVIVPKRHVNITS